MKNWAAWLILTLAIFVAGVWRFYMFGQVPPALNGDEAVFGVGALQLLREGPSLYIEGQGGGGILAPYIVALFFLLLEPGKMALRFQASLIGTATIVLLFFAARVLFLSEGKQRATLIAALASLILALNYTHITISRIAFAIVHLPFLQLLAVLFFWLAFQKISRLYFFLAGISLAGILYGYISGIVTPALFFTFVVISLISAKLWPEAQPRPHPLSRNAYAGLKYFLAAFVLFILPLVFFYLTNLDRGSAGRVGETSFLNPNVNQGDPLGALWRGLSGNYAVFGLAPLAWLLSGQWSLFLSDVITLATFVSLIIASTRFKRPPYQFILLWWGLTILPSALAPTSIPHAVRAIGVYAPISILVALVIAELWRLIGDSFQHLRARSFGLRYFGICLGGLLLLAYGAIAVARTSWQQFDYYFYHWPQDKATLASFDLYAVELAQDMAALAGPQMAYILPLNTSAGSVSPNGTVNFLYGLSNSPASHHWLTDDEDTLPGALTAATKDASTVGLIRWKTSKHTGADPKSVFDYYLEKYGRHTDTHTFRYYDIDMYHLNTPGQDYTALEALQETEANFGGQVRLTGYAYGNTGSGSHQASRVQAGDPVWVRLRWQKVADHQEDLKVSLIVKDSSDHRLIFMDKHLQSNFFHERFGQWPQDAQEETYFIVPLPQIAMPGEYIVSILVYIDETLAPLPIPGSNQLEFPLGRLQLAPAETPVTRLPSEMQVLQIGRLETLELYTPSNILPDEVKPGQGIDIEAIWRAGGKPVADYDISVILSDGRQEQLLLPKTKIGGGAYPTGQWRPGEYLSTWLPLKIAPGTSGEQELRVVIWQGEQQLAEWPFQRLTVTDWEHHYTLPEPHHKLEATLGDRVNLLGYHLEVADLSDGDGQVLNLTLYWQGSAFITDNYISFVHLLGADGQVVSQMDHVPDNGDRPTTGWLPGEIISDRFALDLPSTPDFEALRLIVGMYSQADLKRLPVQLEQKIDDKIMLPFPRPE